MNLAQARIVLRPRGRLELLDLAFRCMLGGARRTYASLCAALLLPAYAATAAAHRGGWSWFDIWLLALGLGTLVSAAFTAACGRLLFEPAPPLGPLLRGVARRLPTYLGARLLSLGFMLIGSIALIGGFVAWYFGTFIAEAVLLEQASVGLALRRSAQLSRADGTRALGVFTSILAVSIALVIGVDALLLAVIEDVLSIPVKGDRLFEDGGSHFALAGYFCSVPWAATSRFLAYIDGRTRQDGWDLQVRLMARAAEAT